MSLVQLVENLEKKRRKKEREIEKTLEQEEPILSVTKTQVELAFYIRQYRRIHEMSQVEMAQLCSLYGKPYNVKFSCSEISSYENYKHKPTPHKFQVLMNTMDLDPSCF